WLRLTGRRGARDDLATAGGNGAPPGPASAATRRSGCGGGDRLHTGQPITVKVEAACLTEAATAKPLGTKARLCQKEKCRPARPRSPVSPCFRLVSLITSYAASDEHILVQASAPCRSLDSDRLDTHRHPRPSTVPGTDLRVHPAPLAPFRSDERRADLHRHVRLDRDLRGRLPASGQAEVAACRLAAWFVSRTGSRHFSGIWHLYPRTHPSRPSVGLVHCGVDQGRRRRRHSWRVGHRGIGTVADDLSPQPGRL